MSPNRLVEFEFNSFLDAATYVSRPEIAAIVDEFPNRASNVRAHTFIQRSDYSKDEEDNWPIKSIYLIDYPPGGNRHILTGLIQCLQR